MNNKGTPEVLYAQLAALSAEERTLKNDPNNLISEPFVDSLAKIQHEKELQKITARQERKKIRDKKLVATYLSSKFPDAFSKDMTIPEKEFPRLLKLARNHYWRRFLGSTATSAASIVGLVAIFLSVPPPSWTAGIASAGLIVTTFIFSTVTSYYGSILKNGKTSL